MRDTNKFNKINWEGQYKNAAQILATKFLVIPIASADKSNYAPFTNLEIYNRSTSCILQIKVNAVGLGDDSLSDSVGVTREYILQASQGIAINWKEDKPLIYGIVVSNTHAADALAAGELVIKINNYTD